MRKPGRPCKEVEDKQSKMIGLRVTPSEYEAIRNGYLDNDEGCLSAALRDALLAGLSEKEQ